MYKRRSLEAFSQRASLFTMKNPITNSALYAAALSIIAKMVYHILLAPDASFDMYTRFFYLLCFLAALFFGLRSWKLASERTPFTEDVKAGMKIASIYALVIGPFTWVYYKWINPAYFTERINARVEAARTAIESGQVKSEDVSLEQVEQTASFIFDPFTHSSLTLFGFLVLGFFYTLIIVMLFRWRPKAFGLSQ